MSTIKLKTKESPTSQCSSCFHALTKPMAERPQNSQIRYGLSYRTSKGQCLRLDAQFGLIEIPCSIKMSQKRRNDKDQVRLFNSSLKAAQ